MVKKATRLARFVEAVEDQPVTVGLAVQKKKTYSVALFSSQDRQVESYTCIPGHVFLRLLDKSA